MVFFVINLILKLINEGKLRFCCSSSTSQQPTATSRPPSCCWRAELAWTWEILTDGRRSTPRRAGVRYRNRNRRQETDKASENIFVISLLLLALWFQMHVAEMLVSHGASLNAKTFLEETPIGAFITDLLINPIGVRNQALISAGFHFPLLSVQLLCYTSCFKFSACFTAVTLWVNSVNVFVRKCKRNMSSLKGMWRWYFPSFLRSVWGRGVQSHPARPETQTWHHHEVATQTQDLSVQADVQRRKSWVRAATCW